MLKILGNQMLVVSENDLNQLLWVENGRVGPKITILALIVEKIAHFTHFGPFLGPFWPPGGNLGYQWLEVSEINVSELPGWKMGE